MPIPVTGRSHGVDAMKFLAALAVICIHLMPATREALAFSDVLNSAAVPFFLTISLTFLWNKFFVGGQVTFKSIRWDRILIPYLVWSFLYISLRMLEYALKGKWNLPELVGIIFYGEAAAQLYFIPLLVVYQLLAVAIIGVVIYRRKWWIMLLVLAGYSLYFYYGVIKGYWAFNGAFERGILYILVSIILAKLQTTVKFQKINPWAGFVILALIAALVLPKLVVLGQFQGPLIGFALALIALNLNLTVRGTFPRFLLGSSYGIYLSHFLFIAIFEQLNARLGWNVLPYSLPEKFLVTILVCCISLIMIRVIRTNSILAYLFLGESSKRRNA